MEENNNKAKQKNKAKDQENTKQKREQPEQSGKQNKNRYAGRRGNNQGKREHKAPDPKAVPIKIMPLGGLGEIGCNMTLYECQGDMFIVDCGSDFPDDDMLGIDLVIPDFTYVKKNAERIRGIAVTHGHEDHIGALPYFLKQINVPVYGTKLTLGLVSGKLREHGLFGKVQLNTVNHGDKVKMGCMEVEFVRVNHSIPDASAIAIHSPAGIVVQTGDFKVDYTPIEGKTIDLARFGELGNMGVKVLLSESTNVERPGSTPSERKVGESFESLFNRAKDKRIIIATFSSNIYRIQQIINTAFRHGRKVVISGRSMENVTATAVELGYLNIPEKTVIPVEKIDNYDDSEIVVITTGSQGEPLSALSRMSMGEHRKLSVTPNDFIIISANTIPGNENAVNRVINELMRLGADVLYEAMYEVHVSGHACQEELKLMISLTKPQFFIPVHGEYRHLKKHADLAAGAGVPRENIMLADIGDVINVRGSKMVKEGEVIAGHILVDGSGVGDVGNVVLRDRKHLSEDGLFIVVVAVDGDSGQIAAGPDIVSRGFVYVRESEEMMGEARRIAKEAFEKAEYSGARDWGNIKTRLKDAVGDYLYSKTKRRPMILTIIEEI